MVEQRTYIPLAPDKRPMRVRIAPGGPGPRSSAERERRSPKPQAAGSNPAEGAKSHRPRSSAEPRAPGFYPGGSQVRILPGTPNHSRLKGIGIPAWFRTRCFRVRISGRLPMRPSEGNWHTCLLEEQAFPGSTPGAVINAGLTENGKPRRLKPAGFSGFESQGPYQSAADGNRHTWMAQTLPFPGSTPGPRTMFPKGQDEFAKTAFVPISTGTFTQSPLLWIQLSGERTRWTH